jgi:hypothetical protein
MPHGAADCGKETGSMTFLEAALEILKRERKPLHYKELTEKAMERKLLTFVGRTPEVTMQTQLTNAVKKAPGAPFVRVKPGVFGLLRYPEAVPEPKVEEEKAAASEEKSAEPSEARGRRRRRGGRGRRKDRRGGEDARSESRSPEVERPEAVGSESALSAGDVDQASALDDQENAEEPNIGSLSAEARAAALAETGVLEGDLEDEEGEGEGDGGVPEEVGAEEGGEEGGEEGAEEEEEPADTGAEVEGSAMAPAPGQGLDDVATPTPVVEATPAPAPAGAPAAGASTASESQGQSSGRRVMSPVDAAIEILREQSPGRGVHVRQIADSAVRRRLIHGEPNEAWRVMRAALASEAKERLRAGLRPRIKSAGSGLFALSRRVPDADLEKAEYVFGEARRALRERTVAAVEQRLGDLAPPAFEALARVVLQREGFGPATFVKRVEGTIYVEALRGRGFRPSKCLIALRPGVAAAGRRALGELRAGIRARGQDEGLLILAGRLADDAIAEWKQAGQPVEVVDGPALAETCVRHGIGVIGAQVTVDLIDADFFAELAEG